MKVCLFGAWDLLKAGPIWFSLQAKLLIDPRYDIHHLGEAKSLRKNYKPLPLVFYPLLFKTI